MTDAAKEARRAYTRAYYAAHREQLKANHERYWERRARVKEAPAE